MTPTESTTEPRGGAPPRARAWQPHFYTKSPLFWPIRPAAEQFAASNDWPSIADYNRALGDRCPVRFREQPPRPRRKRRAGRLDPSALYDARIHLEGWVPTRRNNWHDFFNMLVWSAFPRAKAELHARQHRAIAARIERGARTLPPARTRELDGLAILDEGGLVLLCEAPCLAALQEALWRRDLEPVREALRSGRAAGLLFGHALYESLLQPGPMIYAMACAIGAPGALPASAAERIALADSGLSAALCQDGSFSRPETFRRLPVDERVLCVDTGADGAPGGPRVAASTA